MTIRFKSSFLLTMFVFVTAAACQTTDKFTKFKSDADVPRITLADAKKDFDAGTAVFIDARPESSYKAEHITGAINVPYGSDDSMMDKIPKGKTLIIYCS